MKLIKFIFVAVLCALPFLSSCDAGECLHKDIETEVVAPDCENAGMTVNTCLSCGFAYNTDITSAMGHDFKSKVVEADCENGGYTEYTCECGSTYKSDFTSALEHDYKSWITAPTCDENGYTTYICKTCDRTYTGDYVKPLGHNVEKKETVAPTCQEQGYTAYACSKCDYKYLADYAEPAEHLFSETVTAPTCTTEGYTTYECSSCDYKYVSDFTSPTGHSFTAETLSLVSCTDEGKVKYTCVCGAQYESIIPPTGHDFEKTVISPTVKDMGYTSFSCECGFSYNGNYRFYSEIVDDAYAANNQVIARGIDISRWNHTVDSNGDYEPIDWAALKNAGVDYVILKIGSTISGLESTFEMDYAGAKAAGIDVGVYFFTYSTSVSQIKQDAETLLSWLEGKQFEYPIYLDVEDATDYKPSEIAAPILTEMCLEFFSILQAEGYYTGLYINKSFLMDFMQTENMIDLFDIWYARYPYAAEYDDFTVDNSTSWNDEWVLDDNGDARRFGMWQFSCTGVLEPFPKSVDFNYCYKDYPTIIKNLKMNNYDLN